MPALLFASNVNSAFFQLKPTLKPERPGSPEFSGKTMSAWDSNPRLVFLAVPSALISLNGKFGARTVAPKRVTPLDSATGPV